MRTARELFIARGFAKTPLRTIASEAGTSESGVLRIYGSKSGLLRAVYGSCWAEINDSVDQAMVAAAEDDPDPRNLLFRLVEAVWQVYHNNPLMMVFMLSHFGFRETTGLTPAEDIPPDIDREVKDQYRRYMGRVHDICDALAESQPVYAEAGVTSAALSHVFISIIYGIQTGWYMAQQAEGATLPQVSMDEALTAAKFLLYSQGLDD